MSSPIQLLQPFLSEPVRSSHSNLETSHFTSHAGPRDLSPSGYENLDYATDLPDFLNDHSLSFPIHDSHSFAGPLPDMLQTPFVGNTARMPYGHLRNISFEDTGYRQFTGGRGHSHSLSLALNLADPPEIPHSHSASTFLLLDLIPPLLLLVSNQLLADSPYSAAVSATTPGRRGISKSFSLSNMFATPSRVGHSPSVKVGKTPLKGHRRTRSKAVEAGSSNLLATIANMKSSTLNHIPYEEDTSINSNPFDTTLMSPRLDNLSDYDATPLTTPAKFFGSQSSQYFTPNTRPISHSTNFGGNLDPNDMIGLRPKYTQPFPSSQSQIIGLPRSETLDSMNVEEQDDDACKQLRKAKSFTTFQDPTTGTSRSSSMRNIRLDEYLASSPSKALDPPAHVRSQNNADSVDLLQSDLTSLRKNNKLSSYPASIDLASITRQETNLTPNCTSIGGPNSLLPTMANMRSAPVLPLSRGSQAHEESSIEQSSSASTPNQSYSTNLSSTNLRKNLKSDGTYAYPSASEIKKASTTREIANFAEKILNSDLKRPIVIQEDSKVVADPKKKHVCPLCFARFQRPEHVKRHLKSHSDEKPFECDFPDCDRRFNRKDNLKAHLKKIHKKVF